MKIKSNFVSCKKDYNLIREYLLHNYQNKIVVAYHNLDSIWTFDNLHPPDGNENLLNDPFIFVEFEYIEDAIEFFDSIPITQYYTCIWEKDEITNENY